MVFDTAITTDGDTISGPARGPRQMLGDQEYDGHASVHDGDVADKLGLPGAPIEGPDPLQPDRSAGVLDVGPALVRDRLNQRPLPDDGGRR